MITIILFITLITWEIKFPARKYESDIKRNSYLSNGLIFIVNNLIVLGFSIGSVSLLANNYKLHDLFSITPDWLQFVI